MGIVAGTGQYVSDRFSNWRRKLTDEEIRSSIQTTFSILDASVQEVHWCGNGSILVHTQDGDLHTEVHENNTTHLRSIKSDLVQAGKRDYAQTNFHVTKLIHWENQKDLVMILTNTTVSFLTSNCGRFYKAITFKSPPSVVLPHPTKNQIILAMIPSADGDLSAVLSKDLGETWHQVSDGIHEVSWIYSWKLHQTSHLNPDRLMFVKRMQGKSLPIHSYSIYYTEDFFSSTNLLLEAGTTFAFTQHFIYAAKVEDINRKEVGLYVAPVDAHRYNLKRVKLPFELLKEHAYTVLEPVGKHVFIHVTHSIDEISTGHLYVSDSTGSKFELTVKNNIRTAQGYCDFNKVQGMEGVYIANVYTENSLARAKTAIKQAKSIQEKAQILAHTLKKKSLVTYDFGRTWRSMHIDSSNSE